MPTEPLWLAHARTKIGVTEIKGSHHNPTIIGWANLLGAKILGVAVKDDETPWCGLFVAMCMHVVGIVPPKIAIRAKSWAAWGTDVKPCAGAVLVFGRDGGGHVGFYVKEDAEAYYVLGGNQSNSVNTTRIAKSRLIACRWPAGHAITTVPVIVATKSKTLSRNEA